MKNVICARCVKCGKEFQAVPNLENCSCGGILDIIYDYEYIKTKFTKEILNKRTDYSMWRYREVLPVEENTPNTPLRVGWSPHSFLMTTRFALSSLHSNLTSSQIFAPFSFTNCETPFKSCGNTRQSLNKALGYKAHAIA